MNLEGVATTAIRNSLYGNRVECVDNVDIPTLRIHQRRRETRAKFQQFDQQVDQG